MARLTEQEFKKQLGNGELPPICLIYGDEDYLKKHYAALLQKKAVDDDTAGFNLHKINGDDFQLDAFYQAAQSMPFMSEYNCVCVKDLAVEKMKNDDFDALMSVLSDLSENCVVIFFMDSVALDEKKSKTKDFIGLIEQVGVVLCLNKMSGASLYKLLENGAAKRKCTLSRDCSAYLVSRAGDDLNTLLNELEKLCFYKGEGEIKRSDIDLICIKSLDASVFDLSKALVSGTAQQAFDILNDLLAQKEKPVVILGILISTYVDMYRAQVALASGEAVDAPAKIFNYRRREFLLKNAARNSANMTIPQIRDCLEVLADADSRIKSTALDERRILEEVMLKLMLMS